jgi:hypothetical protein
MYVEHALKTYLEDQSGLAALIGEKLFYVTAPQDTEEPYVILFKVSETLQQSHDGNSHLATARVQFSVFADTYLEVKQIAAQIKAALIGRTGLTGDSPGVYIYEIAFDNETDMYESEVNIHHLALEFLVTYQA